MYGRNKRTELLSINRAQILLKINRLNAPDSLNMSLDCICNRAMKEGGGGGVFNGD